MFSSDDINKVLNEVAGRLKGGNNSNSNCGKNSGSNGTNGTGGSSSGAGALGLTPAKALVIAGLLGGALEVESVLVDKAQAVEIVLTGSLKQKTQLEKVMDQIGTMPFDEVVKAFLGRLS